MGSRVGVEEDEGCPFVFPEYAVDEDDQPRQPKKKHVPLHVPATPRLSSCSASSRTSSSP